jgi:photosystem II stability/assembly factor-like uncharacterized protein
MEGSRTNGGAHQGQPDRKCEHTVKDDSQRDKAIDKLLGNRLKAQGVTPGAACPDAEVLATYVERALTPQERAAWETHFDSCMRCQMSIAELVRLSDTDPSGDVPKLHPAGAKPLLGLRWAWAAPMLVVLIVAGLWYTGEFGDRLKQTSETNIQLPAPRPAPAKSPEVEGKKDRDRITAVSPEMNKATSNAEAARPVEASRRETQAAVPREESTNRSAPGTVPTQAAEARQGQNSEALQLSVRAPVPAAKEAPVIMADRSEKSSQETAGQLPESARAEAKTASGSAAGGFSAGAGLAGNLNAVRESRDEAKAQEVMVTAAAPPATERKAKSSEETLGLVQANRTDVAKTANEADFHYARVGPGESRGVSVQSLSLQAAPSMWRVGPGGLIQKAVSQGNWESRPSGVVVDLLNIAIASPKVFWVVGKEGTILRSTDGGNTWEKISSPILEDIIQVKPADSRSAQVTTLSGRVYSTTDGGATWSTPATSR